MREIQAAFKNDFFTGYRTFCRHVRNSLLEKNERYSTSPKTLSSNEFRTNRGCRSVAGCDCSGYWIGGCRWSSSPEAKPFAWQRSVSCPSTVSRTPNSRTLHQLVERRAPQLSRSSSFGSRAPSSWTTMRPASLRTPSPSSRSPSLRFAPAPSFADYADCDRLRSFASPSSTSSPGGCQIFAFLCTERVLSEFLSRSFAHQAHECPDSAATMKRYDFDQIGGAPFSAARAVYCSPARHGRIRFGPLAA